MKNESTLCGRIQARDDQIIITRDDADTTTIPLAPGLEIAVDFRVEGRTETGRITLHNDELGWAWQCTGRLQLGHVDASVEAVAIEYESPAGGMLVSVVAMEAYRPIPHAMIAHEVTRVAGVVRGLLEQASPASR
jgi:hypothetical protein